MQISSDQIRLRWDIFKRYINVSANVLLSRKTFITYSIIILRLAHDGFHIKPLVASTSQKALCDDIDSHRTSTGMTYDPWIYLEHDGERDRYTEI